MGWSAVAGVLGPGGKSELRRAGRRVTPGGGNPWKVPQKTDRPYPLFEPGIFYGLVSLNGGRGKGEKVG